MSNYESNEGIVMSGGTINADALAVGRRARATVESAREKLAERGQEDLGARIDALLAALEEHRGELADPDAAFELTGRVAEELQRERPDKATVEGFLSRIAGAAGSVGSIVTAATGIAHAVAAVL